MTREKMAENLKYYLKMIHMSGSEYGRHMGLSRQGISSILTGRTKFSQAQYLATLYIFEHCCRKDVADDILNDSDIIEDWLNALKKMEV